LSDAPGGFLMSSTPFLRFFFTGRMSAGHVKQEPVVYEDLVEEKESVLDKKNEPTVSKPRMYLKRFF